MFNLIVSIYPTAISNLIPPRKTVDPGQQKADDGSSFGNDLNSYIVYDNLGSVQFILFSHLFSVCVLFPSYIKKLSDHQPIT